MKKSHNKKAIKELRKIGQEYREIAFNADIDRQYMRLKRYVYAQGLKQTNSKKNDSSN